MVLARRTRRTTDLYGYTVDEVARFLQYDLQAVRYWLRTGHLAGCFDERLDDWRVTANDLVAFLRQTSEPMPTGVVGDLAASGGTLPADIVFAADGAVTLTAEMPAVEPATPAVEGTPRVRTRKTVLPAC